MASSITEAEIFDALNEALAGIESEDGYTSKELRKVTGWGEKRMLDALEALIVSGRWEPVKVVRTSTLTTITRPVNGYRPVRSD